MQELFVLLILVVVFVIVLVSFGFDVVLVVCMFLYQGWWVGLVSVLGLVCGIFLYIILVLIGVLLLFSCMFVLFVILQVFGVLYLVWFGVGVLCVWLWCGDGQLGWFDGVLLLLFLGFWLCGVVINLFNFKVLVFFIVLFGSLIFVQMLFGGKLVVVVLLFGMGVCWFGLFSLIFICLVLQVCLLCVVFWLDVVCGVVFLLVVVVIFEYFVCFV